MGLYSRGVVPEDELDRAVGAARGHGDAGDVVSAVLPTEPEPGRRVYLCAFDGADGFRSWLAVDGEGRIVADRAELRSAISIAALCEVAADAAGGGDVDELIARLEELRAREGPPGFVSALEAARELRRVLGEPPELASGARLDEIGAATRRLEKELDPTGASPFATAMQAAQAAVAELQREIEAGYRGDLR
jgi:hypothetical protein